MLGWLSAEVVRASRWKRSVASGSAVADSGRNFIATWRPSRGASPRYTTPMPPPGRRPPADRQRGSARRWYRSSGDGPCGAGEAFRDGIVVVHVHPVKGTT